MTVFSQALASKIEGFLGRYETKRSAILPVLHAIQDECGWIQEEHIAELDAKYQLHRVEVREVLTFYSMYRQTPPRKFEIYFCNNLVCHMMGAREAMAKIEERIRALEQKMGNDCPFNLRGVPCLGVCDGAPAMLVNKDRHLKITAENVETVLEKYAPLR